MGYEGKESTSEEGLMFDRKMLIVWKILLWFMYFIVWSGSSCVAYLLLEYNPEDAAFGILLIIFVAITLFVVFGIMFWQLVDQTKKLDETPARIEELKPPACEEDTTRHENSNRYRLTINTLYSFLMDAQARKKLKTECHSLKSDSVPLYDRECAFALKSTDGAEEDRGLKLLNASRCFNCASYSHSLKDCPKPRDNVAVSNARKEHQSKKKHNGGPHVLTRYYQNTPRGKYDGLKPCALDSETRKLLGLSELDPPPWLNRMRELGYPPGYLEIEDDQLSGITIYADEESYKQNEETAKVDVSEARKKKTVDFPGVNAPIPKDADQNRWAVSQVQQFVNSAAYQSNQWLNWSPEFISRGHSYLQRQQSNSMDSFFSSNAQKLDSFMSNYSGYSHYKESDYAHNNECRLIDGLSRGYRSEFMSSPGYMRSNEIYALSNSSESSWIDGFTGFHRDHESDVRARSTNDSPFSIKPHQFAYSRQN